MARDLKVTFRDRKTGDIRQEQQALPWLQRLMGRSRLVWALLNGCLNTRWFCRLYGWMQDRSASKKKVGAFVAQYGIDLSEVEKPVEAYGSLNAFFSRRLKAGVRPFVSEPEVLCSPADGKVLVYAQLDERTRLPVKGAFVDVVDLLASEPLAEPFYGGSALVVRLAPYDYHRFHFPVEGVAGAAQEIAGRYYLVNPLALSVKPDLFAHNKRMLSFLETERFGRVAYVEVAGFAVGRMVQTYVPGDVARGQEKGYFQFGGSTLVLLFEPDVVMFDEDLLRDTLAGVEVQVLTGAQIGRARL